MPYTNVYRITVTERDPQDPKAPNTWYRSGNYQYDTLREARESFDFWVRETAENVEGFVVGVILWDHEKVLDFARMTERQAARNATGNINNIRMRDLSWP